MIKRTIKSIIPAQGVVAQFGHREPVEWRGDDMHIPAKITREIPVICWALMKQDNERYVVGMTLTERGDIDTCDNQDNFLGYLIEPKRS